MSDETVFDRFTVNLTGIDSSNISGILLNGLLIRNWAAKGIQEFSCEPL